MWEGGEPQHRECYREEQIIVCMDVTGSFSAQTTFQEFIKQFKFGWACREWLASAPRFAAMCRMYVRGDISP